MECRIIAGFDYKEMKYYLVQIGQNSIYYAIKNGKKIITKLEKDDLRIFNIVYNSLRINKDESVNLGIRKVDNVSYEIYYDPNSKLHYWNKIDGINKIEASAEENYKLNYMYNHIPEYFYQDDTTVKNTTDKKFIQRLVRDGKKTIMVLVAAGISFSSLTSCRAAVEPEEYLAANSYEIVQENKTDENKIEQVESNKHTNDKEENMKLKEERRNRPYSFDEVKEAVVKNKNLGIEEKAFIYKLKFVFDENHQYMDMDSVLEKLENLEIIYREDGAKYTGCYNIKENKINIFASKSFEDADISTVLHEVLHVCQTFTNTQGRTTMELSNELMTRETIRRLNEMGVIENREQFKNKYGKYSEYGHGYTSLLYIEYYLAELLTQEQMQDYQFCPDEDVLINRLVEIDENSGNEDKQIHLKRAYKLLDTIDSLRKYNEKTGSMDFNFTTESYYETYCDIYNQIDYYYQKLYGKSMAENPELAVHGYKSSAKEGMDYIKRGALKIDIESIEELPEIFTDEREDAFANTVVEMSDLTYQKYFENEETGLYYKAKVERKVATDYFVLPRTYFTDKYKHAIVFVDPERCDNDFIVMDEEAAVLLEMNYDKQKNTPGKTYNLYSDGEER